MSSLTLYEKKKTVYNDFNNKNQEKEIKLINGYELTKTIRNHKSYIMKEGLINEVKYNI